jgi:hypothetical protein
MATHMKDAETMLQIYYPPSDDEDDSEGDS